MSPQCENNVAYLEYLAKFIAEMSYQDRNRHGVKQISDFVAKGLANEKLAQKAVNAIKNSCIDKFRHASSHARNNIAEMTDFPVDYETLLQHGKPQKSMWHKASEALGGRNHEVRSDAVHKFYLDVAFKKLAPDNFGMVIGDDEKPSVSSVPVSNALLGGTLRASNIDVDTKPEF